MNWCMANDPDLQGISSQSILEQNLDILRKFSAFKQLDFEIINLFALMADRRQYSQDELIFSQGEKLSTAFMILSGDVTLFLIQGEQAFDLELLHCGDHFAYMALLADMDAKLSARACCDCELLTIDRENFRKVMIRFPESCIQVVEKLIQERMARMHRHMQKLLSSLSMGESTPIDIARSMGM
ncbi:Cyclic nucleotide-binding domain (CNMP-BD) protein [Desulfamplus magnetovallimortis]|uniref:Cyclic nucleotide-binding domain (CNMP-BD) protein n=1 Tax=Desulfamplus magnetovallimortis TaxID=1246637 RepID=A0A1W1HFX6_9BACT|nr:Crp/Fnr family transcriptional regulator [Desulfamplus magnetovallimortis]SLM31411.1 Cyclic nucleotide-binding domain (CNMP-BD) protein [Desulfamplus magnetovallimortis]